MSLSRINNWGTLPLFLSRLNHHPRLRERMETLLKVVENVAGDCTKADAAEQAVLAEIRKMGNEALQGWAERAVQKAPEMVRREQPALRGNGKKKSGGIRSSGKSPS
jgi:hypothetical protein